MTTVYFITHPNVVIDPAVPIPEWPLSELGIQRMQRMLKQPWVDAIQSIYCSTEQKAIDGAIILAEHRQLPFQKVHDLGENDRSATGYLPASEFESVADEFFGRPQESVRGWETASHAQQRIIHATKHVIAMAGKNMPIAIVAHGAVGTLLLCHLAGWPIARKYDQPGAGGGNYFAFEADLNTLHHGWQAIDGDIAS